MNPVEAFRDFITARLTAAAGEIFTEFQQTIYKYQQEIDTQQRLIDYSRKEQIKPPPTDEPQQDFCREQQHSSLDQEEPEPPRIKEEQLGANQFADTVKMTAVGRQNENRENVDSYNSVKEFINQRLTAAAGEIFSEFQQTVIKYQEMSPTQQQLLEMTLMPQIKHHKNGVSSDGLEQQMNIGLEQLEGSRFKEEQKKLEASLIKKPEDPENLPIKEEERELSTSPDEEQLVLRQEDEYLMMIPIHEQSQPIETEPNSELLFFHDSGIAGIQNKTQVHLLESGSTPKAATKSIKRLQSEHEKKSPSTPQSSLSVKRKTQRGNLPHSCEMCGKTFQCPSHLLIHMRTHTLEKPFSCETCGKSFNRSSNLLRHMRLHSGKKTHSCGTCGKSFSQHGDVLRHMRIHTGEKPYSCVTCGKSFAQSGDLVRHTRLHTQ